MNVRLFGIFILVLGLLLACGAGIYIAENQPKTSAPSRSVDLGGGVVIRNDLGGALDMQLDNMGREERRKNAIPYAIGGAVVAIVGLGMVISGKRKDQS